MSMRGSAMAAAIFAFVVGSGADWPQFRGKDGSATSSETGLLREWPSAGPRVLWRAALGEGYSGLTVAGGRVFTLAARGDDELAFCFDAEGGAVRWSVRVDRVWKDAQGNGPRATPVVDGSRVYVLSGHGRLSALAVADGALLWSKDLVSEFGGQAPRWGYSGSPIVEGPNVIVEPGGTGGRQLVALDRETGSERWRSLDDRPGYATPVALTLGGVRQLVTFSATALCGVAVADGRKLWSVPWKTSFDVNAAMPVFVPPDAVFVSSGYDVGGALYRLKNEDGTVRALELWRNREMKNQFSSSVYHAGTLYGFDDRTLKALDAATGRALWRERALGHGSLIAADGLLFVLGDRGQLVLVPADPKGYRESGRIQLFGGKTWTAPSLADGRLFLRDETEVVALAVSLAAGTQKGEIKGQ